MDDTLQKLGWNSSSPTPVIKAIPRKDVVQELFVFVFDSDQLIRWICRVCGLQFAELTPQGHCLGFDWRRWQDFCEYHCARGGDGGKGRLMALMMMMFDDVCAACM